MELTIIEANSENKLSTNFFKHILDEEIAQLLKKRFFTNTTQNGLTRLQLGYFLANIAYAIEYTHVCLDAALNNTNDPVLIEFFKDKKKEEAGHVNWAYNDLNILGFSSRSINQEYVDQNIKDLMGYLLQLISDNPENYLIYLLIGEYVAPSYASVFLSYFNRYDPSQLSNLTCLSKHIELDLNHVSDDLKIIQLYFSEMDTYRVKKVIADTMYYLHLFYENIPKNVKNSKTNLLRETLIKNMTSVFLSSVDTSNDEARFKEQSNAVISFASGYASPIFNGIFMKENTDSDVDYLKSTVTLLKERNLPFLYWYLADTFPPASFQKTLDNIGLTFVGTFKGIALDLENYRTLATEKTIKSPENEAEFSAYINIMTNCFAFDEPTKFAMTKVLSQDNFIHYLAYENNQAVSVLTSYIKEGVVGIYNVATLPEKRNQGFCTALLNKTLQNARALGCHTAIAQLDPDNMAISLFQKTGFKEVSVFNAYAG